MKDYSLETLRENYDRLATEYARRIADELNHKPLDRELLEHFAEQTRGKGVVCDLGCGPGHVARYLRDANVIVFGLDLSPRMLEEARRMNPDIPFREGNMMSLDLPDATLAGITAFYAIVTTPKDLVKVAFQEMARTLKPDGLLLIAFHVGRDVVRLEELLGVPITMDFFLFETAQICQDLEMVGLTVDRVVERDPYPEVEYQSRRAYIFARKRGILASPLSTTPPIRPGQSRSRDY